MSYSVIDGLVFIFVPSDIDLKFVPLVTLVQLYVSTKLKVSTAVSYRENRKQGTVSRWHYW